MNTDRLKVKALTKGDNPEWVEGQPLGDGIYTPCLMFTEDWYDSQQRFDRGERVLTQNYTLVDINTLCQCTGLEDSNDDLIYEGDEVVVKDFRPHDEAEYDPLAGVFDEYEDLQAFVEYRNGRHYICSPGYMLGLFGFQSTQMTLTGKNIHDPK